MRPGRRLWVSGRKPCFAARNNRAARGRFASRGEGKARNPAAIRWFHICRLYSRPFAFDLEFIRAAAQFFACAALICNQTAAFGDANSGEHVMLDTILLAAGIVGLLLDASPTPMPATACEGQNMIFDYILGSLASLVITGLSRLRADQARALLGRHSELFHDLQRLAADRALLRRHHRHHAAVRRLYDARLRRRAHFPSSRAAPGRARDLLVLRRRRDQGAALADLRRRACCSSASPASSTLYALQRLQAVLPFNPQGQSAVEQSSRLQHLGELRHQHQLAMLRARDDDELPRPDGGAHRAQFRVGGDRHRAGASR